MSRVSLSAPRNKPISANPSHRIAYSCHVDSDPWVRRDHVWERGATVLVQEAQRFFASMWAEDPAGKFCERLETFGPNAPSLASLEINIKRACLLASKDVLDEWYWPDFDNKLNDFAPGERWDSLIELMETYGHLPKSMAIQGLVRMRKYIPQEHLKSYGMVPDIIPPSTIPIRIGPRELVLSINLLGADPWDDRHIDYEAENREPNVHGNRNVVVNVL